MNFVNIVSCWVMVEFDIKVGIRKLSNAFFYIVISVHDHHCCSFISFFDSDFVIILEMN